MKYTIEWQKRGQSYETGPLLIGGTTHPPVRITCTSTRTIREAGHFRTNATWTIEWNGATATKPTLREAKLHVVEMLSALMVKGRAA